MLQVNAYAMSGGASVAARRLCTALNSSGVESLFLVQNAEGFRDGALRTTGDRWARHRPVLDALPVMPWRHRRSPHWGNAWLGNRATRKTIEDCAPDITHLHWINHGMLSLKDLRSLKGPVVWTFHDSWAFTGGCHSPQDCRRYCECCGKCPELGSRRDYDLSRWNWRRKRKAWQEADFAVIAPSRWMAELVRCSSLHGKRRIEIIPNVVDAGTFYPMDRKLARQALGLPADVPLLLFGAHGAATDWNKGLDLLAAAIPRVQSAVKNTGTVLAGCAPECCSRFKGLVHNMGVLSTPQMALAMNAANAVVIPSRMENLPYMAAESLTCGTPVAAFAVGGIPEMIRDGVTGRLASPGDVGELAEGIVDLLVHGDDMREACTKYARAAFAPDVVARRHIEFYHSVLKRS